GRRGRYGPPRIPAQPHWSRSVVGIAAVVALMVIVPILASMLSPSPGGPSSIIRIDGDFSDWAPFPAYADSPTDQVQNPGVNLLDVKVATQNQNLFVKARVQGLLFQGSGSNETDSVFVFLDEDNNRNTGYPIGDLGADAMVEIYGWRDYRGLQHGVDSFRFNETGTPRSNDWRRFVSGGSADAAVNGQQLELRTTVADPAKTRILVYAADNLGDRDSADGSVVPSRPTVVLGQQTVAPDVVAGPSVAFLRVTMSPMGGSPRLAALNVTRLGTSTDAVDLSLYRVDGAFGDWRGRPYGQDILGDVTNRTGAPEYDANVDLVATAVDLGTNFTGYVRVDGRVLGGQDIPTTRSRTYPVAVDTDLDTVPDAVESLLGPNLTRDFNNDNVTDDRTNSDVDGDGIPDYPAGPDCWLN